MTAARADIGAEGLRVAIGLPSAVMLVIGGMVGVGIFVNPAVVARGLHSPFLVLTAWVSGGVITLLGAVVYAELSARVPATGGEYAYLREAFGPMAGFLFGWTSLLVVRAGGMAAGWSRCSWSAPLSSSPQPIVWACDRETACRQAWVS